MATLRFRDEDRDERGFVKVPTPAAHEPRSLADLLPTPQSIQADAQRKPTPKGDQALMIIATIVFAAMLVWRFGSGGDVAPQSPASIPASAQASGDRTAMPAPSPAAPPAKLPAYAAPNGTQLGQIEATRAITPTAHYGADWIQADVAGSGLVWLRASDWHGLAIVGPDLAPRPTPTARPYVSPTPEPEPPCHTAGMGDKQVTVCGWLSEPELEAAARAKWAATYGGTIGSGDIHPTPQEWNKP